jgi:catechol 2,3-dioxygenase-like lactoylglutathione lyase family enzyme
MADKDGAPAIEGVLETSLYARDLKRTAAFYRDLFGFKALVDSPRLVAFEIAQRSVLLVFQAGATEQDVVDPGGTIPGHDGRGRLHLAFSIRADDLDAWRERLAERGVDIVGEYRWPRGGTSLYMRDPDGALVELATPGLWWRTNPEPKLSLTVGGPRAPGPAIQDECIRDR